MCLSRQSGAHAHLRFAGSFPPCDATATRENLLVICVLQEEILNVRGVASEDDCVTDLLSLGIHLMAFNGLFERASVRSSEPQVVSFNLNPREEVGKES